MADIFEINIKSVKGNSDGEVNLVELRGKLDKISSPSVMRKIKPLIEQGDMFFIMDLDGLEYIDSAGIYSILQCYSHLKEKKKSFKLIRLNENIRGVLNSMGVTKIIPTYASLKEALKG